MLRIVSASSAGRTAYRALEAMKDKTRSESL
jgi:hypothetical protein